MLQATDWGSWAGFMSTGMKVGTAPGYKVSNVITRCGKGGMLGQQCTMQATLCKGAHAHAPRLRVQRNAAAGLPMPGFAFRVLFPSCARLEPG